MHQVPTISVQLAFRSAHFDWYWAATSVPFGRWLIDLPPRTDDHLCYCTSSGNIPSKFYVPDNLKHLKFLGVEHTKFIYSPNIPTFFPRMQNSVSKNLSKRLYPISQRLHRQLALRKLVRSEVIRSHVLKNRDEIHELFLKRTTWKDRRSPLSSQKTFLLKKSISPFVINHLS